MERKIVFIIAALLVLAFSACDDNEDGGWKIPEISPRTDITVDAAGGDVLVTVTNYDSWTIKDVHYKNENDKEVSFPAEDPMKVSGGWFTAEVVENGGKYNSLKIHVDKNTGAVRSKHISMSCGELGASIQVIQEAGTK